MHRIALHLSLNHHRLKIPNPCSCDGDRRGRVLCARGRRRVGQARTAWRARVPRRRAVRWDRHPLHHHQVCMQFTRAMMIIALHVTRIACKSRCDTWQHAGVVGRCGAARTGDCLPRAWPACHRQAALHVLHAAIHLLPGAAKPQCDNTWRTPNTHTTQPSTSRSAVNPLRLWAATMTMMRMMMRTWMTTTRWKRFASCRRTFYPVRAFMTHAHVTARSGPDLRGAVRVPGTASRHGRRGRCRRHVHRSHARGPGSCSTDHLIITAALKGEFAQNIAYQRKFTSSHCRSAMRGLPA